MLQGQQHEADLSNGSLLPSGPSPDSLTFPNRVGPSDLLSLLIHRSLRLHAYSLSLPVGPFSSMMKPFPEDSSKLP